MAGGQRQQTLALRKVNQLISKGLTTLRIPHSVPVWACVVMGVGCTYMHMHMEARGQLWMLIPRYCLPCFFRQSLSVIWNLPNRLGCLASKAHRPTCLCLLSFAVLSMNCLGLSCLQLPCLKA